MNFKNKAQSINNYLDSYYKKLLKDGSMASDYQTLLKQLELETKKLSNYKFAIKDEVEGELVQSPDYKKLDDTAKQQILARLERVYQEMDIPLFTVAKKDCLELVTVKTSMPMASAVQKQPQGVINLGTAIGAVVGLGIGLFIQKSFPVILIGGLGGAAVGSFLGKRGSSDRNQGQQPRTVSSEQHQTFGKVSSAKLEAVIQARKTAIMSLFSQYNKQLENACQYKSK